VLRTELLHLARRNPPIFASATVVCIQTRHKEQIIYAEGGETLAQLAQRGGRCPVPGTIKAKLDGALSTLMWLKMSLLWQGGALDGLEMSLPTQTIL